MPITNNNNQSLLNRNVFNNIDTATIQILTVEQDLYVNNIHKTSGATAITIHDNVILDGNLDISGSLSINNLDVSGTLTVNGKSYFYDEMKIINKDPALILQSIENTGLVINSNTDASNNNYNYIAMRSNGTDKIIIGYDDTTTKAEINKNCATVDLDIYSDTTFKQNLFINNNIDVSGDAKFYNDVDISGQLHAPYVYTQLLNMTGGTLAILPSTVATDISANNIYILNQEIINKSVINDLSANISHFNNTIINDLSANNVFINTCLINDVSANNIDATNDIVASGSVVGNAIYSNLAQINGNLNANNIYSAGYIIGNSLDISGNSNLRGSLDVSGITTLNNTLKCLDVSANNIMANNLIINDISGDIAYFNTITASTFNLGQNIDISGKIEISNSISGLSLPTTTIEMVKNSNINIFGQNTSSSYGWNIGLADKFYIAKYDGSFRDFLTVDSSGKIGINNTAPTKRFQIDCSGSYDEFEIRRYAGPGSYNSIYSETTAGTTTNLYLTGGGPVSGQTRISMASYYGRAYPSIVIAGLSDTAGSTDLAFYTAPSGLSTNVIERMRIKTDGKIGFNNVNPTEILHCISGNLRMENSLAMYNESNTDHAIFQNFNRANSGTHYGAHIVQRNGVEKYAGAVWDDIDGGTMTFNRYNPRYVKYFNNCMSHVRGRYEMNTSTWDIVFSRFTNNINNLLYNNLQRSFYMWDVGITNTTISTCTSTVEKYYNVCFSGFIDNVSYGFDYELRYDRGGVETTIAFTTQQAGQKGIAMNGIALLSNGDEVRLYVKVNAVLPQGGYGYFQLTIHEIF